MNINADHCLHFLIFVISGHYNTQDASRHNGPGGRFQKFRVLSQSGPGEGFQKFRVLSQSGPMETRCLGSSAARVSFFIYVSMNLLCNVYARVMHCFVYGLYMLYTCSMHF